MEEKLLFRYSQFIYKSTQLIIFPRDLIENFPISCKVHPSYPFIKDMHAENICDKLGSKLIFSIHDLTSTNND